MAQFRLPSKNSETRHQRIVDLATFGMDPIMVLGQPGILCWLQLLWSCKLSYHN